MRFYDQIKLRIKKIWNKFKRTRIKAVHEEDLIPLLNSLGIYMKIKEGEAFCVYCSTVITLDNLWGIFREGKSIRFICSNPDCASKID